MAPIDPSRGRLIDVFPPGFDSKSSSSRGHYNFAAEQLYDRLTYDYNPLKHVESTIVQTVWYGKQKKAARHEFILIKVRETHANLTNYIVLDRNTSDCPPVDEAIRDTQVITHRSHSSQNAALDTFRVSYNGNEEQLLRECQLLPRQYLEMINFGTTNPLLLYELVTLVHVVSGRRPNYAVTANNCYWFAGLIWECMLALRPPPDRSHDDRLTKERGRFVMIQYHPEISERDETCLAYQREIELVRSRISQGNELWSEVQAIQRRRNTIHTVSGGPPGPEAEGSGGKPSCATGGDLTFLRDKNSTGICGWDRESTPVPTGSRTSGVRTRRSLWFKRV